MRNKSVIWITTTAVFVALLVGIQVITAPFGQFITGSLVNLILIIAVMTRGFTSGLTVAFISPVFAKLLGVGPLWTIIPFIMAGNIALILVWHLTGKMKFANKHVVHIVSLVTAAVCKFIILFAGIVKVAVPLLMNLPEPQSAVISTMFSFPQLITALIGGALATAILPVLEKIRVSGPDK